MEASAPLAVSPAGELDAAHISGLLRCPVASARLRPMVKSGGLSGDLCVVHVAFVQSAGSDAPPCANVELVLKRTREGAEATAVTLGTAREGKFFARLAPALGDLVPRAYHALGDMSSGSKEVLLEKVHGAVPLGVFFGRGNPNNWQLRDDELANLANRAGAPSAAEATAEAFALYARLHSQHWRDPSLLAKGTAEADALDWLRGSDWARGESRDTWERALALSQDAWSSQKEAVAKGLSHVSWVPHVAACLDASFAKAGWEQARAEASHRPWTLVHGDAHPHNVLCAGGEGGAPRRLVLVDFEMVGVGSGPQDLGQFAVSHMNPELRRAHERSLVRGYHARLQQELRARDQVEAADTYTLEACWTEYVAGGAGRWLWFVPYLAGVCPPAAGQFFHDQLAAFLEDHVPDPAEAPAPRV